MAKRPFQFHLSTLLIAVLVLGFFIMKNLRYDTTTRETREGDTVTTSTTQTAGWPLTFLNDSKSETVTDSKKESKFGTSQFVSFNTSYSSNFDMIRFAEDSLLCIGIIVLLNFVANRLMRRGTPAKPKEDSPPAQP